MEKQEAEKAVDQAIKAMAEWITEKLETEKVMPGEIQSMTVALADTNSARATVRVSARMKCLCAQRKIWKLSCKHLYSLLPVVPALARL